MNSSQSKPVVAFVATRLGGLDGVALIVEHARNIFHRLGYTTFRIAGDIQNPEESDVIIPLMHLEHPTNLWISDQMFKNRPKNSSLLIKKINKVAEGLKQKISTALSDHSADLLVIANAIALPGHIPLAKALKSLLKGNPLPTIAYHADFWWEREWFANPSLPNLINQLFPFDLPNIRHWVINSLAQKQLKEKGIKTFLIPDVFDFDSNLNKIDDYNIHFRKDFKISKTDRIILQPTRIIPRKGIENAIDFVNLLKDKKNVLVMAGYSVDKDNEYERYLKKLIRQKNIRAKFIGHRVSSWRHYRGGKRVYTLWDCYVNSDFVTLPSIWEGFCNHIPETIYFKKPFLVNAFKVWSADIAPTGIKAIVINNQVTQSTIKQAKKIFSSPRFVKSITDHNFKIGKKYFSYPVMTRAFKKILASF